MGEWKQKFRFIKRVDQGWITTVKDLGPDYMSRAGPVSRAVSVCRDNFQPGFTWGEPARLMADAIKRGRPDAMKRGRPCLILVRRRHEPLDVLWREVVVFKTDTTRTRRMIVIAFFQELDVLSSAFMCMDFNFCFFYIERGILICWRLICWRNRNLFVKKYKELKLPAVLSLA